MKRDGTQINCYTNLRKLWTFLQPTSRKFWDYTYYRQPRNIQPDLFQTVKQDVYRGVLEHLYDSIWCCCPKLWATEVFQLHDNAWLCTALSIKEFLSVHQITVLLQAPYSPDLSPYNFFLFPWLKRVLKGHKYNNTQAVQSWQNSSAAFQQVLARTTSKTSTNAGSGILMKEEGFQRKSLAPECKNTRHIFTPSVLELYTHRVLVYFKTMQ